MKEFFIILYFSVIAHELGHFVVFLVQGIKVNEIMVFPLRISMSEGKLRVGISGNILYSGLVIPKIPKLDIETENEFKKIYEITLLAGPISNLTIFVVTALVKANYQNGLLDYLLIINMFMIINCFVENVIVLGDFVAYSRIRKCRSTFLLVLATVFLRNERKSKENADYLLIELNKEIGSQEEEKIKSKMKDVRETIMRIEW